MKSNIMKALPLVLFWLPFTSKGMEVCTFQQHRPISADYERIMSCIVSRVNTHIGIFTVINNRPRLELESITKTTTITNFTHFIRDALSQLKKQYNISITRACFGVPGNPSANQDIIIPFHAPFAVSAPEIRKVTSLEKIRVVNDFEVIGFGIGITDQKNIITLNEGMPREHSPKAIIGAGNGLGSCLMIWDQGLGSYKPMPLAFAYTDFAALTPLDISLANFIKKSIGQNNISWGYMLGLKGGIKKIYEFLLTTQGNVKSILASEDVQEIFDKRHSDSFCKEAVDVYMQLYIRLLRNATYTVLPYGGLYITNTVAEKNPELFTSSAFMKEFWNCNNEQLLPILKEFPVYVVTDSKVKIYGAAQYLLVYT